MKTFKTLLVSLLLVLFMSLPAIAGPPSIYAPDGTYLGNASNNPYDPNSVSNPYGQYGSKYAPDSINNPYGQYGSKYSPDSANNPYASPGLSSPSPPSMDGMDPGQ